MTLSGVFQEIRSASDNGFLRSACACVRVRACKSGNRAAVDVARQFLASRRESGKDHVLRPPTVTDRLDCVNAKQSSLGHSKCLSEKMRSWLRQMSSWCATARFPETPCTGMERESGRSYARLAGGPVWRKHRRRRQTVPFAVEPFLLPLTRRLGSKGKARSSGKEQLVRSQSEAPVLPGECAEGKFIFMTRV